MGEDANGSQTRTHPGYSERPRYYDRSDPGQYLPNSWNVTDCQRSDQAWDRAYCNAVSLCQGRIGPCRGSSALIKFVPSKKLGGWAGLGLEIEIVESQQV